jgi:hypothetical protein
MDIKLREALRDGLDEILTTITELRNEFSPEQKHDPEYGIQDHAAIAIEMMLRTEYGMSKTLSEDIAANAVRRILPYLRK